MKVKRNVQVQVPVTIKVNEGIRRIRMAKRKGDDTMVFESLTLTLMLMLVLPCIIHTLSLPANCQDTSTNTMRWLGSNLRASLSC